MGHRVVVVSPLERRVTMKMIDQGQMANQLCVLITAMRRSLSSRHSATRPANHCMSQTALDCSQIVIRMPSSTVSYLHSGFVGVEMNGLGVSIAPLDGMRYETGTGTETRDSQYCPQSVPGSHPA